MVVWLHKIGKGRKVVNEVIREQISKQILSGNARGVGNMKRISRRNSLCAMCTYWDGFRLLYLKHHSSDWFDLDDRKEAACFHPDKFGQYKKRQIIIVHNLKVGSKQQ